MIVLPVRPYAPDGLPWRDWSLLPLVEVDPRELVGTQEVVDLRVLLGRPRPDPLHVVAWRHRLYIENGHVRAARAIIEGRPQVWARLLEVEDGGTG